MADLLEYLKGFFSNIIFRQKMFSILLLFAIGCCCSPTAAVVADEQKRAFHPIRYKNCKSQFELLDVLNTANCNGTERCQFPRGSNQAIQIIFKPNRRVETLRTSVWAHLGDARGALTRFYIENENACVASNLTCPLEAGKTYWYMQPVRILAEYPLVDVQVNWLLTSADGENVGGETGEPPRNREICVKMLAKVME